MAKIDRFYIGMLDGQSTLQTSLKQFAIPDNAYAELNNAYIFRGRVKKRFGAKLMIGTDDQIVGLEQIQSRLKINIGTTNAITGAFGPTIIPGAAADYARLGKAFSVGSSFFTVYQNGTMYSTTADTGSYNTATGAVTIASVNLAAIVYYYPSLPVMGLPSYENRSINVEDLFGFDTQFAYRYESNGWERAGTAVWTGSDSDLFWAYNAQGPTVNTRYLYVTNYNFGVDNTDSDPIRYWDGSTWIDYTPQFSATATDLIWTCRIIVFYKNRLVFMNIVQNTGGGVGTNTLFVNRVRWSAKANPVTAATSFVVGDTGIGGGVADIPVSEAIVTAQFVKDQLIIYCERSSWAMIYTGNEVIPFIFQKINTELGAESTFSQVPFDKVVLGIGNVGIHACNGVNVERIDDKIPDTVFNIHNDNNGIERVYGIRDYFAEVVYWSLPGDLRSDDFPFNNRVLTYNYKNGAWGFNDDSITAFGYFQTVLAGTTSSPTWDQASQTWEEADFEWQSSVLQAKFRHVVAGNQEGWTFVVDPTLAFNSESLQITNITYVSLFTVTITAYNHNLQVGDYIRLENVNGITGLSSLIVRVDSLDAATPQNIFTALITDIIVTGTYTGGGTLTKVTPIDFKTKQYNFYAEQGYNAYVSKVDFLVDNTESGQCTVDFLISSSDDSMLTQAALTGAMTGTSILETSPYLFSQNLPKTDPLGNAAGTAPLDYSQVGNTFLIGTQLFTIISVTGALSTTGTGTGTLNTITGAYTFTGAAINSVIYIRKLAVPYEAQQERLWHPVYFYADGEYVQLHFKLNDEQTRNSDISEEDFELHAMNFYCTRSSNRLQ